MEPKKLADITGDLTEYTRDDLVSAVEDGYAELERIIDTAEPSKDDVQRAREVHARVKEIESRVSEIDADAEETKATFDDIRATITERAAQPEPEAVAEADEPEQPETDEVADETPEAVEETPEVTAEAEETPITDTSEEAVVETSTPEPVAASARERLATRRPAPPAETAAPAPKVLVAAAADAQVFSSGATLEGEFDDVVKIVQHRFSTMRGGGGRTSLGVATFQKPMEDEYTVNHKDSDELQQEKVDRAANEFALAKPLTAAGWCSPSETIYDLCEGMGTEGMIDLPEIRVNRGGIRYTSGPDFSGLYSGGFWLTEAEAIADTAKTCVSIPCPTFDEVRLDAVGICLTSPLLTKAAYPELEAAFLREAMVAHQLTVSNTLISKMVAASTAEDLTTSTTNLTNTSGSTLAAVELIAYKKRQAYRWGDNVTIEVVAPMWLRGAFRADLANRTGVDMLAVSNGQIDSYFAARNVRVQYVYGWQDLASDAVGYPATVDLIMYKAGTFVKGTSPVISLNAIYDSAGLTQNEYTALFFEEGIALVEKCYGATVVTTAVCSSGQTGATDLTACMGDAIV
jgi:hypothetical protein